MFGELMGEALANGAKLLAIGAVTGAGATVGYFGTRKGLEYMELIPAAPAPFDQTKFEDAIAFKAAEMMMAKVKTKVDGAADAAATAIGAAAATKMLAGPVHVPAPAPTPAPTPTTSGQPIGAAEGAAFMALIAQMAGQLSAIQASSENTAAAVRKLQAEVHGQSAPATTPATAVHRPAPNRSASANPRLDPAT